MNKQVEKTLSVVIKAAEAEAYIDVPTDDQDRAYTMSLLKDTKVETTPAKPILKNVALQSILGKVNISPK